MQNNYKVYLVSTLVVAGALGAVIYFSSALFIQLFLALMLAYILNPAVTLLENKGLNRSLSIILVFLVALLAIAGFTAFLTVSIAGELSRMQLNIPAYARHLYNVMPDTVKSYLGIETEAKLYGRLTESFHQLQGAAPDLVQPVLKVVRQAFTSTIGVLLSVLGYLVIPVYLFYLLADLPHLARFIVSYVPERFRPYCQEKVAEIDRILSGFIRGQLAVCAALAVLYSIGLYFIGIDLAVAIGVLAGGAFIIPYVGTVLGIVLSVLMALLKFNDLLHPLLCVGWFALVQLFEGMILTPKIVGDTVGLHPLVAIIALLVGGQWFGILGMLVAVPAVAVMQVFLRSLSTYYKNSEFFREG